MKITHVREMDGESDKQMDRWTSWELVRKTNRQDSKIREKQKTYNT